MFQANSFAELYNIKDFYDPSQASCWIRFYSSIQVPKKYFHELYMEYLLPRFYEEGDTSKLRTIIGCAIGAKEFKAQKFYPIICANESGLPVLWVDGHKVNLPDAPYIMLATPYQGLKETKTELEVKQELDYIAALLRAYIGRGALQQIVYECEYTIHDHKEHEHSPIIENISPADMFRINLNTGASVHEIIKKLMKRPKKHLHVS